MELRNNLKKVGNSAFGEGVEGWEQSDTAICVSEVAVCIADTLICTSETRRCTAEASVCKRDKTVCNTALL